MKYYIKLARNGVIFGEVAVIKKKELARQVFVRYSSQCSYLIQMIQLFSKFNCIREYLKRGILGAFKYLASTFYLFLGSKIPSAFDVW